MKRIIYLLLITVLCCRCSLFKNVSAERSKDHQLEAEKSKSTLSENLDKWHTSDQLFYRKDTAFGNYMIQIYPKGQFTLSPEKGFSGEAVQVLIRGSTAKSSSNTSNIQSKEVDQSKRTSDQAKQLKTVTDNSRTTKKSSPSWKWVLIGLLLIIASCWLLYNELKRWLFKN